MKDYIQVWYKSLLVYYLNNSKMVIITSDATQGQTWKCITIPE